MVQSEKRDSQQKLAMADLRLKLRTRDRELHKQMQKVSPHISHYYWDVLLVLMLLKACRDKMFT